jgi:hypothetical protein
LAFHLEGSRAALLLPVIIYHLSVSDNGAFRAWLPGTEADRVSGKSFGPNGEGTMITAIVIPADPDKPLTRQEIGSTDLRTYRSLVGGNLQVLNLERPSASLYINEDGKFLDLPVNPRATVLLWAHNYAFIGNDWVVGDAFLVGPVGRDGADTTVPEIYISLLLEARYFRLEVQTAEDDKWHALSLVFDSVLGAYAAAIDLARQRAIKEVQVVGMT